MCSDSDQWKVMKCYLIKFGLALHHLGAEFEDTSIA